MRLFRISAGSTAISSLQKSFFVRIDGAGAATYESRDPAKRQSVKPGCIRTM
ncbi:hypothetical protein METH_23595 (plasmid) [Leisingera methylohalidivorans DSM 14336]|uniref:Uncharacterized protein n=1 Tax=Leisingera methylohalidivorans DSM 14336 TaxID=999552 RepID=V9VYS8_9RHOB|nr:hypothetical protein METH_23595 [Leisingera methylohalidivorans DSM 14336]